MIKIFGPTADTDVVEAKNAAQTIELTMSDHAVILIILALIAFALYHAAAGTLGTWERDEALSFVILSLAGLPCGWRV